MVHVAPSKWQPRRWHQLLSGCKRRRLHRCYQHRPLSLRHLSTRRRAKGEWRRHSKTLKLQKPVRHQPPTLHERRLKCEKCSLRRLRAKLFEPPRNSGGLFGLSHAVTVAVRPTRHATSSATAGAPRVERTGRRSEAPHRKSVSATSRRSRCSNSSCAHATKRSHSASKNACSSLAVHNCDSGGASVWLPTSKYTSDTVSSASSSCRHIRAP